MKIALDTALGKEAFVNIIVAVYVAPYYLASLCERLKEPPVSMFKAEDVKKIGHFLSKRLIHYLRYVTAVRSESQQAFSSSLHTQEGYGF